jgi:hypothetical protein
MHGQSGTKYVCEVFCRVRSATVRCCDVGLLQVTGITGDGVSWRDVSVAPDRMIHCLSSGCQCSSI